MNLQDLFTVANLTAAVNKLPAIPGKVGAMGLFDEKGVTSTSVVIDEREGRLVLVPNTSRNDDPAPIKGNKRKRRTFESLHLPISRPILPSQLHHQPTRLPNRPPITTPHTSSPVGARLAREEAIPSTPHPPDQNEPP